MPNTIGIFRQAIYTRLTTALSPLVIEVTQDDLIKVFYYSVPQTHPTSQALITTPYVVFDIVSVTETRDTAVRLYQYLLSIKSVSSTQALVETLSGYVRDLMDDAESIVAPTNGFSTILISPQQQIAHGKEDLDWSITDQYIITLQH